MSVEPYQIILRQKKKKNLKIGCGFVVCCLNFLQGITFYLLQVECFVPIKLKQCHSTSHLESLSENRMNLDKCE